MAFLSWDVWRFALCIGIGGGLAYDAWSYLSRRMGVVVLEWGMLGRALIGQFRGQRSLCDSCHLVAGCRMAAPSDLQNRALPLSCQGRHCGVVSRRNLWENLLGWTLHYLWCVLFSLPLPLIWGPGILHAPHLLPFLAVTVVGKVSACLLCVSPVLGYGLFVRNHYNPVMVCALVTTGYCFAAMAQYGLAVGLAEVSKLAAL